MVDFPDGWDFIRPSQGEVRKEASWKDAGASGPTSLVTIEGKGVIYGGCVYLDETSSQAHSYPYIIMDGHTTTVMSLFNMNKFTLDQLYTNLFYLLAFDEVNYIYSVGLFPGITFNDEIELKYMNNYVTTPRIFWSFMYSLIA